MTCGISIRLKNTVVIIVFMTKRSNWRRFYAAWDEVFKLVGDKPVEQELTVPDNVTLDFSNLTELLGRLEEVPAGSNVNLTAATKTELSDLFSRKKLFPITIKLLTIKGCPFYDEHKPLVGCTHYCGSMLYVKGQLCACTYGQLLK